MEQSLAANDKFTAIKSASNSIALIRMLEQICFNYQLHEYPPLGAWEAIDNLGRTIQSDTVLEANHYEKFKTIVEVCKANGINFSVLCSANVDTAISILYSKGKINQMGTYEDGTYLH